MSFFDDLGKIIGEVGSVAKESVGIYNDIMGGKDEPDKETVVIQQPQPTYSPNINANDFAFMPDPKWLIAGGFLLVIAFVITRK